MECLGKNEIGGKVQAALSEYSNKKTFHFID
ncbi:MAG: hypothetical protein ACI9DK_002569 [Vicingaceae bacterium]|jgi:hypothetical protein